MNTKIKITIQFILSHIAAYLLVSIPFFQFVMKQFYEGESAVFPEFLITEESGEVWTHAMQFLLPALLLQAFLISVFLWFIWDFFAKQSYTKQFMILVWMRVILGGFAAISPAVGTLEGLVFMIPQVTLEIHSLVVLEVLLQALVSSVIFLGFVRWKKMQS